MKLSALVSIAAVIGGSFLISGPADAQYYPANNHFRATPQPTPYAPPRNYMSNQIQQHNQQMQINRLQQQQNYRDLYSN